MSISSKLNRVRLLVQCFGLVLIIAATLACKKQETAGGETKEPEIAATPETAKPEAPAPAQTPQPAPAQTEQQAAPTTQAEPAEGAANLLKNADFSSWASGFADGWNKDPWARVEVKQTDQRYDNNPVVQVTPPSDATGVFFQEVPLEQAQPKPGDTFKGSVAIRAEAPDVVSLVFYAQVFDEQGKMDWAITQTAYQGNGQWATVENSWTVPANAKSVKVIRYGIWSKEGSTKPIDVSGARLELVRAGK